MRTSHIQRTTIRAAFDNIKVMPTAYTEKGAIIGEHVAKSLAGKAGITNELDWNAKLSMKTAQELDAPTFNPVVITGKGTSEQKIRSIFNERAYRTGTYNRMVN